MSLAQRQSLRIVDGGPRGLFPEGLVPSIAAGEEPAAACFYEATSGLLFGLLLLTLNDTTTAEVVLSEVYAEVRQHAASFDKNHEGLLTWLITIAHRHALEHLCSNSRDQQFAVSVGLAREVLIRPAPLRSASLRIVDLLVPPSMIYRPENER